MKKFKNIYVEITKACNLKCPFCPSQNVSLTESVSFDKFKHIIKEIKDYTDGIYLHILGEPLLHKDVFKMIEYASKYVKVSMTTNGRLISKYLEELSHANLYVLNISMQSLINENNEVISEYLNNIKNLIDNRKNKMAIHLRIWNDKEKNRTLNETLNLFLKTIEVDSMRFVNVSVSDEFEWPRMDLPINETRSSCLGGKSQMGILSNGDIVVCCLDYLGDTLLGNIYEDNFDDILTSSKYLNVLAGWHKKAPYLELCKRCTFRNRFKKEEQYESQNN